MEFEDFRRRIRLIQEAMVKRGISENGDYDRWCYYLEPAISNVSQKTMGCDNHASAWRTSKALWVYEPDCKDWAFKYFEDLTDKDLELFCKLHDITNLVPPEVYGGSKLKLHLADEVEFMDI